MNLNGAFSQALEVLEQSGFISIDYTFSPYGKQSGTSIVRVKDNYLRFYLKVIEPLKPYILKGGRKISSLSEIKSWESIAGLQFENLILGNRDLVLPYLDLKPHQIVSSAPWIQFHKKTRKTECQVDLLIHTTLDVFYLCEMKFQKRIDTDVIDEVKEKMKKIKIPRRSSLKPVLICEGEISYKTEQKLTEFFYKIIKFQDLLIQP